MFQSIILKFLGLFGKGMFVSPRCIVKVDDTFTNEDTILDLGGGGEGVIGILRGKQVTALDLRKDELNDIPDGPIKVVGDARSLQFPDNNFSICTAFFFLMYVQPVDQKKIFEEAYRVLKPNGKFIIYDVVIPLQNKQRQNLFVVPVKIVLPFKTIQTAYGTPWKGKSLKSESLIELAESLGFEVIENRRENHMFYIKFLKK